jgi:small subunit ribosomal protein S7
MARRRVAIKRKILPDPVYHSDILAKFINTIMERGKKSIAESIVYNAFDAIKEKLKADPLEIFHKMTENVSPMVEVKAKRVGGSTYQIPVEVRPDRRLSLAMRWIIEAAKARSGKSMAERLALEIMDAAENRGGAVKKRDEVHKMAQANKAFAHYKTN